MSSNFVTGNSGQRAPGKRVLVVDDDRDSRDALVEYILEQGFQAESAKSGLEALERLRWGFRPCLILLDLQMDVMTGWEFRVEQKKDPVLVSIPTIAMTGGYWKDQDIADFAACLSKPIDHEELQRKLNLFC
jgi:CheY-like chemotaxis protein